MMNRKGADGSKNYPGRKKSMSQGHTVGENMDNQVTDKLPLQPGA